MELPANASPGGFWRRAGAAIIDGLILTVIQIPVRVVLFLYTYLFHDSTPATVVSAIVALGAGLVISFVYYAWFYQTRGASPGKMILDLRVIDDRTGGNLGYKQTFMREIVGKAVSSMILGIGFLMVGLRHDKRALHDLIAETRVLHEPKS